MKIRITVDTADFLLDLFPEDIETLNWLNGGEVTPWGITQWASEAIAQTLKEAAKQRRLSRALSR